MKQTDDARPCPQRFWWLKRLALGYLVIAVLVAGLRGVWGRVADRRLAAEIQPILARGEPMSGPALNVAPIPDAENGALLLLQAARSINPTCNSPTQSSFGGWSVPPYPPTWHKLSDAAVAAHGRVYQIAREARAYDKFDWGVKVGTPAFAALLPHLNGQRNLANLLGDGALYAEVHGDHATAVEMVRDARHLSRAADAPPTFLIAHLVSIGIDGLVLDRLNTIAPMLEIESEGAAGTAIGSPPLLPTTRPAAGAPDPTPRRPATRAQVSALIAELLDDAPQTSGVRTALVGERAGQLDTAHWFGRGARLLRPMFDLDTVRMIRGTNTLIDSADEPDIAAARAKIGANTLLAQRQAQSALGAALYPAPGAKQRRRPPDYTRLLSNEVGLLPTSRIIEQDMRIRMERGMAAVVLAGQLYRADHGGQWPATLGALVPKYLPKVPLDPLASGGQPLRYALFKGALPDGGDRPVVYSVGDNGVDDTNGDATKLPGAPQMSWIGRAPDQHRDLSRWQVPRLPADSGNDDGPKGATTLPATLPSAPQAAPEQPQKTNQPGQGR